MNRTQILEELATLITAVNCNHPVRVAIDGVDAAGKTTLADELTRPLNNRGVHVIRASIDGFHNPRTIRYRRGPDSPKGYYYDSFDYMALISSLLAPLGPEGNRGYREAVFDYRVDRPVNLPDKLAPEDAILLFDGVFLLRAELSNYWDLTIFVDVSFAVSLERAIARDAGSTVLPGTLEGAPDDGLRTRYRKRYIPGQRLYFEKCRPKDRTAIVVNNDDLMNPQIVVQTHDLH